jgi:uncharacterized membrane protein
MMVHGPMAMKPSVRGAGLGIELTAVHWIYVLFIGLAILFMILRRDIAVICIAGIFVVGFAATGSLAESASSILTSFMFAISELLSIILIISIIAFVCRQYHHHGDFEASGRRSNRFNRRNLHYHSNIYIRCSP